MNQIIISVYPNVLVGTGFDFWSQRRVYGEATTMSKRFALWMREMFDTRAMTNIWIDFESEINQYCNPIETVLVYHLKFDVYSEKQAKRIFYAIDAICKHVRDGYHRSEKGFCYNTVESHCSISRYKSTSRAIEVLHDEMGLPLNELGRHAKTIFSNLNISSITPYSMVPNILAYTLYLKAYTEQQLNGSINMSKLQTVIRTHFINVTDTIKRQEMLDGISRVFKSELLITEVKKQFIITNLSEEIDGQITP